MNDLVISRTNSTPGINFQNNGKMLMEGKSLPVQPGGFYDLLIDWAAQLETCDIEFDINLEYINSGSLKKLLEFLKTLDENRRIKTLNVFWHYEKDDQDIFENGIMLNEMLKKAQFFFKPVSMAA